MTDSPKTSQELLEENSLLKQRIKELEQSDSNHRRIEESLRESDTKYRLLFNSSVDGIAILGGTPPKFLDVNPAFLRLFGYDLEEILAFSSDDIFLLVHEEDREMVKDRLYSRFRRQNKPNQYEFRVVTKGGKVCWVEVSTSMFSIGNQLFSQVIYRDITRRKSAEKELVSSEENFRRFLDESPFGMRILSKKGETIYANNAILDIYGYEEIKELQTTPVEKRYTPESFDEYLKRKDKRKRGEYVPSEYEISIVRKDKEVRHLFVCRKEILWNNTMYYQVIYQDITERKLANAALREKDIMFRKLISMVPGIIYQFTKRPDGTYCLPVATKAIEELYGCSPEDVTDGVSPILKVILPEDLDKFLDSIEFSANHMTDWICEYRVQIPGKPVRWMLCHSKPEKSADGSTTWYGFNADITKVKETEEALRESEAQFRNVFEQHAAVKLLIDPDTGNILEANKAAADFYGYSREQLLQMKIQEINTLSCENIKKEMAKVVAEQRICFHFHHRLANGTIRDVEVFSSNIGTKGKNIIHSIIHDITDRKIAQEALLQAEQKYRSIFENTVEGIFQSDSYGRITSANPALAKIQGYDSPEELIAAMSNTRIPLYVNEALRKEYLHILHTQGVVEHFEAEFYRKDRSKIWASINVRAVRDNLGNIQHFVGTVEDITSRKEAREGLLRTMERLRRAITTTIQIMATTAELRDPYTAGHQKRTADLARMIATKMGLTSDMIEGIHMSGLIHDIGKISIPAEILSKPGKLNDLELNLIKTHSECGYNLLKDTEFPWPLAQIILQHHEKIDGSGYPKGLKGDEILIESRILAVADVVEAISSHRPYRPSLGINVALEEIEKNRGVLYDSDVVDVCLKLFREQGFQLLFEHIAESFFE